MFDQLTERLQRVFKNLRGEGKLSEAHVTGALREIRLALLEADVNFRVVKDFVEAIRAKATGQEVLQSLTPTQQVILSGAGWLSYWGGNPPLLPLPISRLRST